jgi:site-specific recombinase XerD
MSELTKKSLEIVGLEATAQRAQMYADAALSANTARMYAGDWARWEAWCDANHLSKLGPPGQVALYLVRLADNGAKVATITRALSAISLGYRHNQLGSPRQDPAVQLVLRGIKRKIGVAPEQVEAILPSHLKAMVEALPADGVNRLRSVRNRAALVIGWAGGFRRSELLALDLRDVQEVPEGLRVVIRRSKTDQEGRGRVIGLPYAGVMGLCPVRSFKAWIEAAGLVGKDGPVFRAVTPDGQDVTDNRLSDRAFADVVATAARNAGLEGRFAGHSLRAGLVTSAAMAGKPVHAIMRQTGHKTLEVLLRYVREQGIFQDNAASGLL